MSTIPSPPRHLTDESPFPPDCEKTYSWKRRIASGGFGAVYEAEHRTLGSRVAIKVLLDDVLREAAQVQRFVDEARITAQIAHPGIVKILDHGAEYGVPWIAYELLDGVTLRQALHRRELDGTAAIDAVAQVAAALDAAHAVGVVHRDIKPENVIRLADGTVKVMDFGIAKWARGGSVQTKTGLILGTPAYIAPELVLSQPPSPASDVYALGVMLYELLTGELPFHDESPFLILEKHIKLPVPSLRSKRPDAPADVDAVIAVAMAKKPADRYPSAAQMQQALRSLIDGGPLVAGSAPPELRGSGVRSRTARVTRPQAAVPLPPEPKPRRAVAAALAALVALMALAAWRASGKDGAVEPVPVRTAAPPSPSSSPAPDPVTAVQECRARIEKALGLALRVHENAVLEAEQEFVVSMVLDRVWRITRPAPIETDLTASIRQLAEATRIAARARLTGPIWLEIDDAAAFGLRLVLLIELKKCSKALLLRLEELAQVEIPDGDPYAGHVRKIRDAEVSWARERKGAHFEALVETLDRALLLADAPGFENQPGHRWLRFNLHVRRETRVANLILKSPSAAKRAGWAEQYLAWGTLLKLGQKIAEAPPPEVAERRLQQALAMVVRGAREILETRSRFEPRGGVYREPAALVEPAMRAVGRRIRPELMTASTRYDLEHDAEKVRAHVPGFLPALAPPAR